MHRACDVLDPLIAEILVADIEFGLDLVEGLPRDADPASWGESLQASRDVDTVTVDVVCLGNDISEVHPDPQLDATLFSYVGVAFRHAFLYGERAFDRV